MTIIEDYIANTPEDRQAKLTQLYITIKHLIPEATEKMSYGMPTFYLNGNLVHFANAKNHIGFYPAPSAIKAFQSELTEFKTSKGAIQFPLNGELPVELIKKIVLFRLEENTQK
ncbi:iron chaperone [Enterococcus sp. AZ126]|uniref:iron chaperone n=1 Tax=Enterococcus sp. AZ126 TaxID=2774635 RepID=UPI003F20C9E3